MKTRPARSVLGASVKVVAPTGQYDPTRLINIGTNRWAFKPELGYTGRAGKLVLDVYAGVWFFTANDDFFASAANPQGNRRTQDPIGAFELHVSYDVKPRLWISADVNYWRGGRTSVNGVEGSDHAASQLTPRCDRLGAAHAASVAQSQLQRWRRRSRRRQLPHPLGRLAVRLARLAISEQLTLWQP